MKLINSYLREATFMLLVIFSVTSVQAQRTGLNFSKEAFENVELADFDQLGWSIDDLPASASVKQFAPYAGDQGDFGTCVGWSTGYAAMTIEFAQKLKMNDRKLISMSAFDPYQLYNSFKESTDYNCQTGGLFEDALESLYQNGGKKWLLPEITCGSPEPVYKDDPGEFYSISNYYRLFDFFQDEIDFVLQSKEEKINNIKLALAEDHPVLFGMMLPESFLYLSNSDLWESTEADRNGDGVGGHAMCLVGFDDNKYGGAFEIMNSWGQSWGDEGFAWIKYDDFAQFTAVAYYMEISDEYWPSTGCVYGDCDNGYGRYHWQNGESYEGELKDNRFDGFGIYSKEDGSSYAGEWSNGFMHGKGMSMSSTNYITRGYWNKGSFAGINKPVNMPDEVIINEVIEVEPANEKSSLSGCVSGNCMNGTGRYVYDDGDIYDGEFQNSTRQGFGVYQYVEGDVYKGQWNASEREGLGYYKWPSGNEYIGYWKNNSQNGLGTKYYVGGDIEAGQWSDGNYSGSGLGFSTDDEKVLDKSTLGTHSTMDVKPSFKPTNNSTKLKTSLKRGTEPAFGIDLKFGKKN